LSRTNWVCIGAALGGLALAIGLALQLDLAAVVQALRQVGWTGFAAVMLWHLVPITLCATACRTLLDDPRPRLLGVLWSRLCRDAGGDLLGFVPAAGELLSIRMLVLQRVGAARAAAATVVDLSLELMTQILFTLIGIAALWRGQPQNPVLNWGCIGLAIMLTAIIGFVVAQRLGLFKLLDRLPRRLAADWRWLDAAAAEHLHRQVDRLWRDRRRLAKAGAWHMAAWLLGIGEAWAALAVMGLAPDVSTILAVESLVFALRAMAFFVPAALGVQEGGYIALFAAFGLPSETALALALIKRGRELALGLPVLAGWQLWEARTRWRRPAPVTE